MAELRIIEMRKNILFLIEKRVYKFYNMNKYTYL